MPRSPYLCLSLSCSCLWMGRGIALLVWLFASNVFSHCATYLTCHVSLILNRVSAHLLWATSKSPLQEQSNFKGNPIALLLLPLLLHLYLHPLLLFFFFFLFIRTIFSKGRWQILQSLLSFSFKDDSEARKIHKSLYLFLRSVCLPSAVKP